MGAVYAVLQEDFLRHAHIRINGGKTHVWNAAGIEPLVCEALQRIADFSQNMAWCGHPTSPPRDSCHGASAIDFGQFRLRPAFFFEFGQFRLRPISTSASSTSASFRMLNFGTTKCGAFEWWGPTGGGPNLEKVGPRRVGSPEGWGAPKGGEPRRVGSPEGWSPEGWSPEGWGAQNFTLFFPPPATIFFLLSISWGPFVEFWWCWKRRGPEMCTFGVLGLSCASPGGPVWWGRRGFTRQPESPNVHISGFRPSKTPTKFNEKAPRERKKNENCGGRREKKERNFGRSGGWLSGGGLSGGGLSGGGLSGGGLSSGGLSSGGGFTGGGGGVQRKGPSEMGAGFGVSGLVQVGDEYRNRTKTK